MGAPLQKIMMSQYLHTAIQLATEAAQVVMEIRQRGNISQNRKEDRSLVTEADLRADQIIREGLAAFPEHGILTEEHGLSGHTGSDWVWLVDPLDGTKAYAKGIAGFSVMVGLLHQGQPCLGVVVDPLEGRIYEAVKGEGAFLTEGGKRVRLQVSPRKEFSKMPLVLSTGCPEEIIQKVQAQLSVPLCEPINSVGIKVGVLVRGEADLYFSHHPVHYWDTAAPQAILEEAGGKMTYLDETPLVYDLALRHEHPKLFLASNGTRHAELVAAIGIANT